MYVTAMMDMVHLVVKNKNIPIYEQLRQAINLYDSMFTKAEGEELFASLEVFERYPEGKTIKVNYTLNTIHR